MYSQPPIDGRLPKTIYYAVSPAYPTIQSAVDAAELTSDADSVPGVLIRVPFGTFSEDVLVRKNISFIGDGRGRTIIQSLTIRPTSNVVGPDAIMLQDLTLGALTADSQTGPSTGVYMQHFLPATDGRTGLLVFNIRITGTTTLNAVEFAHFCEVSSNDSFTILNSGSAIEFFRSDSIRVNLTIDSTSPQLPNPDDIWGALFFTDCNTIAGSLTTVGTPSQPAVFSIGGGQVSDITVNDNSWLFTHACDVQPGTVTLVGTGQLISHDVYLGYTPTTPGDWTTGPETVQAALDELGARSSGGGSYTDAMARAAAVTNEVFGATWTATDQAPSEATLKTKLDSVDSAISSTSSTLSSHTSNTSNPHAVTKTQVGLSAVTNDAQLKIASNLSDLASASTARTNLGLGTAATQNSTAFEPALAAGTSLQYYRGDKSWQTLNTAAVPESGSLYFTQARAIASPITGFTSGAGSLSATDTLLQAIQKLDGNVAGKEPTIAGGTVAQYIKGNKTLGTLDTAAVVENASNLYFTNARAIAATLTGYASGAGAVAATDSILQAIQKLNGNAALLAPLASPTFTGTPVAPTPTAGDSSTTLATTAFVASAVPNGSYRNLANYSASHIAARAAGTYALAHGDPAPVTGVGTLYPWSTIYIDPSDFPTVNGTTTKLRIRVQVYVNDVAPTGTYTFGLYPITRPGTSGGAGLNIYTLGTVVLGSTIALATPAADSMNNVVGSDFAIPAAGHYAIGFVSTAAVATSSHLHITAQIQMRNA